MKTYLLAATFVILAATSTQAAWKYVRIGDGPDFEYAKAKCELLSMGIGSNYVVWGSPGYVAGYSIGTALGDAIRQSMFIERCLVLHGWKKVRVAGKRANVKANWNHGGAKGLEESR